MKNNCRIINAMTIDVEDYFHVSAFANLIQICDWDNYESRVENNTFKLLEILKTKNIIATFFVLGWVAERYPGLIKSIKNEGHEIACHGYSHQLIYNQEKKIFREETIRSKQILEDLIQEPVIGYRAASYSITKRSEWALDILAELDFKYDSSIFPVRHDRYGMPHSPVFPHLLKTSSGKTIIEFPLSTVKVLGYRLPISGGGYFRLFPYWLSKLGLKSINMGDRPFIFYLHPWEIDPEQPRIKANIVSRFRHYNNLNKCETRLKHLLSTFEFTTTSNVLKKMELLDI